MKLKITQHQLLLILFCFAVSFIHCPWFDINFDDKEIFKYTGMAICRGGIPYVAFFDHKPPLIFFFNTIHYIFGAWAFWFFDACLVCFTALVFQKVCLKAKIKYLALLPFVFVLLIRNPFISMGNAMTREYSSLFVLLYLCCTQLDFKLKYFWTGLLLAFTFFMQQDQVVLFLPFLIYEIIGLYQENRKKILTFFIQVTIGFLLLVLPILFYFIANHALKNFWEDAFLFNIKWYTEKISALNHFKQLNRVLSFGKVDFIFYGTLLLLTYTFFKSKTNKLIILATITTILLSFISEYLTGKLLFGLTIQYYALPIAITIPFGLYILFAKTGFLSKNNPITILYLLSVLCFPVCLNLLQFAVNTPKQDYGGMGSTEEIKYLNKFKLKDYDVYIAFNSSYDFVYNDHRILSPSPWLYNSFWEWYPNWDVDNSKLNILVNDLEKHQTKFILNFADSNAIKYKPNFYFWNNYIQKNYSNVMLPDSSFSKILYKRK